MKPTVLEQRNLLGLPGATEQKVALSRPVYLTPESQTGTGADLGMGTKDLSERTAYGAWNRLPITVAFLATAVFCSNVTGRGLIRAQTNSYMVILSVRGTTE